MSKTSVTVPRQLSWWEPEFGQRERELVQEVLTSNYINDGQVTAQFEHMLASQLQVKHAVCVTSGTTALFAALAGLGIGPGDEVLVPDVTFIATAHAVSMTGATPVLVDVEPVGMTIDPLKAQESITPATRAIVPVHLSGRAARIKEIIALASKHNLFVVEDAAEAFSSQHAGKYLGTWGDAGCFSFSPNKLVASGQGGAVVTNDSRLHSRLRELKDQGRREKGTGGDDLHYALGYNLKFTNLQAAVGLAQMEQLPKRVEHARCIYKQYREQLCDTPGIRLLKFDLEQQETPLWIDAVVEDRQSLTQRLSEAGCETRNFWHPLHKQKSYRRPDEQFPQSTRLVPQSLWLPSSFQLTEDDIVYICDTIKSALADKRELVHEHDAIRQRGK